MSSYSGSGIGYSGGYSRYNSSYSNSRTDDNTSGTTVPASQRPDGSYREEVRVRPGFVPEGEKQAYIPPPARSSPYAPSGSYSNIPRTLSQDSSEDRVDSWADEEAPILNGKAFKVMEPAVISKSPEVIAPEIPEAAPSPSAASTITATATEAETATDEIPKGIEVVREPRKPSQLATAIDTAIDSLSLSLGGNTGSDSTAPRPIGRFAAQIANEEREGRPAYRRYDSYNREGSGYTNGYSNRDSQGYTSYGNRSSSYTNNWNRSTNQNETTSQQSETNSENRVENDFKSFLEDLSTLRREMAVINAKLEYIRYVKAHDADTLTELEATRLKLEPTLLARLDAIFESIDALAK